jgi:uncharacterized protein (TIGR02453 family)
MDNNRSSSFPKDTVAFLKKLSKNNNREWFSANRKLYDKDFLEPAFQFVVEMGEKLQKVSPHIQAIPKIDKSIFRIHRDVRFSKNKEPYKSNMGLYFWEGPGKKMEGSGFYFHLEPNQIGIGGGMYMFSKEHLKIFRDTVSDPAKGKELDSIVKKITKKGIYTVNGKHYKKTPRGYDPNSKYVDYLLYNGIYAWYDGKKLNELEGGSYVNFIYKIFKEFSPLHMWLVNNILH